MSTTLNKYINFKSYIDKDNFYNFLKNANVSKPPVLILSGPRASGKSFVTAMIQKFYKSLGLCVCPIICQIQSSSDERIYGEHDCIVINLNRISNPDFNAWKNLESDMCQIYNELHLIHNSLERYYLAPDSVREFI